MRSLSQLNEMTYVESLTYVLTCLLQRKILQKAQVLSMMTQTIGNTLDQSFTQMLLAKIARLYKIPDLAYAVEKFQPST